MQPALLSQESAADVAVWRPAVVYALLLSHFGLFGVIIGTQGVLWAEVVLALRVGKGAFGTAQLLAPVVAMALLLMGGPLSGWAGKKRLSVAGLVVLAGSALALSASGGLAGLLTGLLLAGVGNGLLEMAMNAATLDWEQAAQRSAMNTMHAAFSGGAVLGALGGGVLLGLGWEYNRVFVLLAVLCALVAVATMPVRYPQAEESSAESRAATSLRALAGRAALVALALIALLAAAGESFANLWSVILLRELGAGAFVGGAAFAVFNAAMFVGRLGNASVVERMGARVSLIASGAGFVLATFLLVVSRNISLSIAAFVLLGLAVAGVIPTALVLTARLAPGNSGAVAGAMMAVTYVGFIACPPLMGWLAELFSLRVAVLAVALSGVGIVWLTGRWVAGESVGVATVTE